MVCNGHKNSRRAAVRLICRVAKPGAAIEQHAAIVGWRGWLVNTGDGCGTAKLRAEPVGLCCFALVSHQCSMAGFRQQKSALRRCF